MTGTYFTVQIWYNFVPPLNYCKMTVIFHLLSNIKWGYQHTREPSWPQWFRWSMILWLLFRQRILAQYFEQWCFDSTLCQSSPVQSTLCASNCFEGTLCQRVVQSSPPFVLRNVLMVHYARVVQSILRASECFEGTLCHCSPVHPLCFRFSVCTTESIKFSVYHSDILH